jgi:urea transporter
MARGARLLLTAICAPLYAGLLFVVGRPLIGESRAAAVALFVSALSVLLFALIERDR